jgi:hypothetical protein
MGMNKGSGILKNQGDMDQFMDKDFEETDSWICRGMFEIFLIGSSSTKMGESTGVVD